MKLETPIMASLIAILFLVGGTAVITSQMSEYNVVTTNEIFKNLTSQYDSAYTIVDDMKPHTEAKAAGVLGALDFLISGIFNVVQYIWQSISILNALVTELGMAIGMPAALASIIIDIIFAMLGVSIIFSILYLIFRFKPK